MDEQNNDHINHMKDIIEAILFVSERPVMVDELKKVFETVNAPELKKVVVLLKEEYDQKNGGMSIIEIAGGYQMLTNSRFAIYLRDFYKTKHREKLSKPALETLAIIAYKHPVTRADIEMIRGVNSDGVVAHLLNKELIKAIGRKDVPGKPFLYGTTKQFLEYFGLKSLENLPKLEEFPTLQPAAEVNILPLEEGEANQAVEEANAQAASEQSTAVVSEDTELVQATNEAVTENSESINENSTKV